MDSSFIVNERNVLQMILHVCKNNNITYLRDKNLNAIRSEEVINDNR